MAIRRKKFAKSFFFYEISHHLKIIPIARNQNNLIKPLFIRYFSHNRKYDIRIYIPLLFANHRLTMFAKNEYETSFLNQFVNILVFFIHCTKKIVCFFDIILFFQINSKSL